MGKGAGAWIWHKPRYVEKTCGAIIPSLYITWVCGAFKCFGAFVGCRFKRIWCVHRIKINYVMNKDGERWLFYLLLLSVAKIMQFQWWMNKPLKLTTPFISSPVTDICNKSLFIGIFPTQLKFSEIKLSFKVFENVIYWRLYQPINRNNMLVNQQYGFRINSWTIKASYTLINNILLAMNNTLTVSGILCDLEKAFDCVNCDILFLKLGFYEIDGKANTQIKSNFSDRYQRVLMDN